MAKVNEAIYLIENRIDELRKRIKQRGPSGQLGDHLYQAECELVNARMAAREWTPEKIIKRMGGLGNLKFHNASVKESARRRAKGIWW